MEEKRRGRKRFLDYSLSKKVNITLLGMVIIPVLVLGTSLVIWLYRSNTIELYKKNYQKIEAGIDNLEDCFIKVQDFPLDCMLNDSLLRIGESRAIDKDYLEVRKWIDEFFADSTAFDNICITLKNGKQIQAGNFVKEDLAEVLDKIGEVKAGVWCEDEKTENLLPKAKKERDNLLTYYAKFTKYYELNKETELGVVSIRLKEDVLYRMYKQFFEEKNTKLFLVNYNGSIYSATDKSIINQTYSDMEYITDSETGMYWKGKNIYLYSYSNVLECYLIEQISIMIFFGSILSIILILLCALVMCLIFSIAFGRIQKRYIVLPVLEIVHAFEKFEKEEFWLIPDARREDEIGVLQKAYNTMTKRLDNLINQVYKADFEKKEAELRALTEQINPHFLYNSLDSIHWKAIRNKDSEVAEQILALSDVYRYLLNKGKEFIQIKDEIYFHERYLYLMGMRYGERLIWDSQLDQNAMDIYIPKLIIQPLIENSIVHGIEPLESGGRISLQIYMKDNFLEIIVEDTGIGFGKELYLCNDEVESLDGAFALKNINKRLKIYYPKQYQYIIQSSAYGGSCISISIRMQGV